MHTQQRVHRHLHLMSWGGGEVEMCDTCEVDTSVPLWSLFHTHTLYQQHHGPLRHQHCRISEVTAVDDVSNTISHWISEYVEIPDQQLSHFTECAEWAITGLALFKVRGRPRHKIARLCVRGFQRNATREVSLEEEMTQRFS